MPVEHFLGNLHAKENNVQDITCYLRTFLQCKNMSFDRMRGPDFDGTNTMSGHRSGVRALLDYMHQVLFISTVAAVSAASEIQNIQ